MTSFVIAAAIVLSALLVVFANHPRVLRARARKTVVVTLKSGATFKGVLTTSDRDALVLRSTVALGDAVVPVDGELLVLRSEVDYIQLP